MSALCARTQALHIDFGKRAASKQCEVALDLRFEQVQGAFDAALPACRKPIQIRSTDRTGIGAKRHGLDHVRAASDAAVDDQLESIAHGIAHRGEAIDRRRGRVELPAAVIGDHDRADARIGGALRIVGRLQTLDDERPAPFPHQPGDVVPADGAIELAVDVIDQ